MLEVLQARDAAQPLEDPSDLTALVDYEGDVLIGEASHGNHEFYDLRATLTRQLIERGGFSFVAVEADQADCAPIDQCVRPRGEPPGNPADVLSQHRHWPSWMLANAENAAFCTWLQEYNLGQSPKNRVSWQGLDVLPMWGAVRGVLDYLSTECGWSAHEINNAFEAPLRDEPMVPQELLGPLALHLAQMAPYSSATNAETYYRRMLEGGDQAMSARSEHWFDTLAGLRGRERGKPARGIVWAHNTHVGDSRGTDNAAVSIGRLVRERYGHENVMLVGFAGGSGTVMAARRRGAAPEVIRVPEPRPGSIESLLGEASGNSERALFVFPQERSGTWAATERGHRAIGAVYDPDNEIYVRTTLDQRYDAVIWCRSMTPVEPLHSEE